MYERFTDRARKVMQLASTQAQRFNHEYIGTEHVLLGLVAEGSGVAANVLKNFDIDLRKVGREVELIVQHGPGGEAVVMGRLPHTPRTNKAIEYAYQEARGLNHNYVGTEHLLLGLLREGEGVAAQVLMNLGLKLEDVREEVLNLLRHETPMEGGAAPTSPQADEVHILKSPPTATLSDEQLQLIRERIRRLAEQTQVFVADQDFALAARCRDEAEALKLLLVWYEWIHEQS